ncbi:MAG: D-ribose pyranase [Lachnospiraceae bacterium]|nr:D-ribose pyranase [Lachnospiraceae bacterium]
MKRRGVINQPLSSELAGLGHGDTFLLCDAGFPIPADVKRVDMALTFGIPSMKQCLESILSEVNIQKVTIAEEMNGLNAEGEDYLTSIFKNQEFIKVPQQKLVELAKKVKFIVRSGELGCYSNVLMEAASGVESYKKDFIINTGEDNE